MDWIMEPIAGFGELLMADQCSGGGKLKVCECTGGLLVCDCSGGLKIGSTE